MSERNRIIVTKRSDDYHACLAGNSAIWGCGRNITEAVGDAIRSHQDVFEIEVIPPYANTSNMEETQWQDREPFDENKFGFFDPPWTLKKRS